MKAVIILALSASLYADSADEMVEAYEQARSEAINDSMAPTPKPNEEKLIKQQAIKMASQAAAEAAFIAGQENDPLVSKTPEERREIVKAVSKKAAEAVFEAGQDEGNEVAH